MNVVVVTYEFSPYRRLTAAADAVSALAKSVKQLGHDVTLIAPFTDDLDGSGLVLARRLSPVELPGGATAVVYDAQLGSGVKLTLLGQPGASSSLAGLHEAANVGAFATAAVALIRQWSRDKSPPDVLHLHDWAASLVTVALRAAPGVSPPTVLTVHDGTRQGEFELEALDALGVPSDLRGEDGVRLGDAVSVLKAGVLHADIVTTVSPTYTLELRAKQRTGALAEAFLGRDEIVGITSGIDFAIHNPATDAALPARYDAQDPSSKGTCKTVVSRELGLDLHPPRPLILAHLEATNDAGFDVVAGSVTEIVAQDVSLIVAVRGDSPGVAKLRRAMARLTGTVALVVEPDEATVHRLHAAADFTLHAPRHEPCGAAQLVAQRYGALPIARATGGLRDTIVNCDAALETGTGFLFDEVDTTSLVGAVGRAVAAHRSRAFAGLLRRVMSLDVSWDRPARRYVQIYERAAGLR